MDNNKAEDNIGRKAEWNKMKLTVDDLPEAAFAKACSRKQG